jgi:hypothetical protein
MLIIKKLREFLVNTFRRFCLPFIIAVTASLVFFSIIHWDIDAGDFYGFLYRLGFTLILGFPLLISAKLLAEKKKLTLKKEWGMNIFLIIFLVFHFYLLPENFNEAPNYHFFRYFLWLFAFILSILIAPFCEKSKNSSFWDWSVLVFVRLFLTWFFSFVLIIGLILSLTALKQLFEIDISDKVYPEIMVLVYGLFGGVYFIGTLPSLIKKIDYPKILRFFTEYILTPLSLIYAIILIFYLGKILITGSWPEGEVSWLVLLFSVVGVIIYALLYPLDKKSNLLRFFRPIFFSLEIPFLIMLLMAFYLRIKEYGLTEARYLGVLLGVLMIGLSIYYLFSKARDLKIIPAVFFTSALLVSFGPWGVIKMSEKNQINRLLSVASKNDILQEGYFVSFSDKKEISNQDARKISAVLEYLENNHGFLGVQEYFKIDIKKFLAEKKQERETKSKNKEIRIDCWRDACEITKYLNVPYLTRWEFNEQKKDAENNILSFRNNDLNNVSKVTGYDYFNEHFYLYKNYEKENKKETEDSVKFGETELFLAISQTGYNLEVWKDKSEKQVIDFQEIVKKLKPYFNQKSQEIDEDLRTIIALDGQLKILIKNLRVQKIEDKYRIENISGKLLWKELD